MRKHEKDFVNENEKICQFKRDWLNPPTSGVLYAFKKFAHICISETVSSVLLQVCMS